jgi:hypothetical protein
VLVEVVAAAPVVVVSGIAVVVVVGAVVGVVVAADDSPWSLQPAAAKPMRTSETAMTRRTEPSVGAGDGPLGRLAAWHVLRLPCGGSARS